MYSTSVTTVDVLQYVPQDTVAYMAHSTTNNNNCVYRVKGLQRRRG